MRQSESRCDPVEIFGHPQIGIIDHIVGPVGAGVAQRGQTGGGQIISMNVVGEDVIRLGQGWQAFFQALERQAVGGINAGGTQNGNPHPGLGAPVTQTLFGIDPASGARTFRIQAPRFVNLRPGTVAVNPCRAYVNKLSW